MLKKNQWIWRSLIAIVITCVIAVSGISIPKTFLQPSNAAIAPLPDPYLTSGKLAEGEKVFTAIPNSNW
ncbi:MAG: hypothetical protein WCP16_19775 [Pseudanabaena sp. ELA645]|jgi:hypothetical protein